MDISLETYSNGTTTHDASINWEGDGPTFTQGEGKPNGYYNIQSDPTITVDDISTENEKCFIIACYDDTYTCCLEIMGDEYDDLIYINQYLSDSDILLECINSEGVCIYSGDPKEFIERTPTGIWMCRLAIDWPNSMVVQAEHCE